MSFKVLLKKDWKQVSILWMLLVVLSVIVFTVPTWTQLDDFNREIENIRANPSSFEGFHWMPRTCQTDGSLNQAIALGCYTMV
ncbi:hypothetical protein [Exiguobacterium mexicanum]|uniref:hypothetical protein n=1 Tax=Exiguobacterium mexicanum TaxID=340146 RepID=UPI0037BF72EA